MTPIVATATWLLERDIPRTLIGMKDTCRGYEYRSAKPLPGKNICTSSILKGGGSYELGQILHANAISLATI